MEITTSFAREDGDWTPLASYGFVHDLSFITGIDLINLMGHATSWFRFAQLKSALEVFTQGEQ